MLWQCNQWHSLIESCHLISCFLLIPSLLRLWRRDSKWTQTSLVSVVPRGSRLSLVNSYLAFSNLFKILAKFFSIACTLGPIFLCALVQVSLCLHLIFPWRWPSSLDSKLVGCPATSVVWSLCKVIILHIIWPLVNTRVILFPAFYFPPKCIIGMLKLFQFKYKSTPNILIVKLYSQIESLGWPKTLRKQIFI